MQKILAITCAIILLGTVYAPATENGKSSYFCHPLMDFSKEGEINTFISTNLMTPAFEQGSVNTTNAPGTTALKSAKKGLLLSALLPGAGEFYAGSYIKSAVFFLIEVGAWAGYVAYHKKGKDIEKDFMNFADKYWSEGEYWDWIAIESGYDLSQTDSLRAYERVHFSHSLPESKDQQYYEMIGKYDQFNIGWDDTNTPKGRDSDHREHYLDLRSDSNKFLKKATTGATFAFVNHVLSAMDAVWSVNRYNRRVAKTSLRIENRYYAGENCPALCLRVEW